MIEYSNYIAVTHADMENIYDEMSDLTEKAEQRLEIVESSIEAIEYFFETGDREELESHLKYLRYLKEKIEYE